MCSWFIWRKTKFSVRPTLMFSIWRLIDVSSPLSCLTSLEVLTCTSRLLDAFAACLLTALLTFLENSSRWEALPPFTPPLIFALPQPHDADASASAWYSKLSWCACLSDCSLETDVSKSSALSFVNESSTLEDDLKSLSLLRYVLTLIVVFSPGSRLKVFSVRPAPYWPRYDDSRYVSTSTSCGRTARGSGRKVWTYSPQRLRYTFSRRPARSCSAMCSTETSVTCGRTPVSASAASARTEPRTAAGRLVAAVPSPSLVAASTSLSRRGFTTPERSPRASTLVVATSSSGERWAASCVEKRPACVAAGALMFGNIFGSPTRRASATLSAGTAVSLSIGVRASPGGFSAASVKIFSGGSSPKSRTIPFRPLYDVGSGTL